MNEKQINEILIRLDKIVLLLSLTITSVFGTQKKQITRLSKLGLKPIEIACVLDTTQNNVNKTLSQARRGGEV